MTPKIEVRFKNVSVEGDVYVGDRALPSLFNTIFNSIESTLGVIGIVPCKKKRKVSGDVSYCGHQLSEFIPQRTYAYISPHNLHTGEMTVRETLEFSGRCLGTALKQTDPDTPQGTTNYILKILGLERCADAMVDDQMIRGISGGEKKRVTTGIPIAISKPAYFLNSNHMIKIYLFLFLFSSYTGDMLVGPARVFFIDQISSGLDSSTTYNIIKVLRQMVHIMDLTMVISLLQPDPETYKLFDDLILMSEGQIVYQGPCQNVVEFFEGMGFKCPERKGVADFLQEVTSRKDQQQYGFKPEQPYTYVPIPEFVQAFKSFRIGQKLESDIATPYDKSKTRPDALVKDKYAISNLELLKACFKKEWLLTKHNSMLYIFKTFQLTFMSLVAMAVFFRTKMHAGRLEDGGRFFGSLFFALLIVMFNGMAELILTVIRLPVFYKHRDSLFYPAWAFAIPIWVLKIPLSFMESGIWVILTYYTIGYAPDASSFIKQFLTFSAIHQMALSLFRLLAAVARTEVLANTLGAFTLLLILVLGGFIVAKDDTEPWMAWGFYASPMMYAQNALVPNIDPRLNASTVGEALLKSRSFFTKDYWFYISIGVLIGFSFLFNILFILALTFLNRTSPNSSIFFF
ncbi:putative ABC-2 type transporter, plant PDR ABC transporter associated [Helianthus anomalus]